MIRNSFCMKQINQKTKKLSKRKKKTEGLQSYDY